MELQIKNLSKQYNNGVVALKNVSLTIESGLFGLLGPNGAGKSTLMRTIATLQDADSGTVMLGEMDVLNQKSEVRKVLGYLPQEFGVYPRTSAVELLDYLALLKGFENSSDRKDLVFQLLKKVNLLEQRHIAVSKFSGGMRQRFGIAQCLIGNPKLVIVDEPTAGLDPGERNRFYNILGEIGDETIVILSTHIVQDVQELCPQMAIIDKGELLFHGATNEALYQIKGKIWQKQITKPELATYQANYKILSNKLVAGNPLIHAYSAESLDNGFTLADENLEDLFFAKTHNLL